MTVQPLAFALLALLIASPALAATLEAPLRLDAVTLFPGEAQATRLGKVKLEPGEHSLVIKGLPRGTDTASFRLRASAPFDITMGGVEFRTVRAAPLPFERMNETRRAIATLEQERDALADNIRAAEAQLQFLNGLSEGNSPAKGDPAAIKGMLAAIGEGAEGAFATVRKANLRKKDVEAEIARLSQSLTPNGGQDLPSLEAVVSLTVAGGGEAEIAADYTVPGGGRWTPLYEARLTTTGAAPGLTFVTRAEIAQSTGEDWNDIALTLSTARPSRTPFPPQTPVTVARFVEAVPVMAMRAAAPPAPMAKAEAEIREQAEADASARRRDERPATEREANLASEGLSLSYRIAWRVSLPSTARLAGVPSPRTVAPSADTRNVTLVSETLSPRLFHFTAPRISPAAFLMTESARKADAPLLPGPVTLVRDGALIGRSSLPFTPAGEPLKLGFGEDERVRVSLAPLKQQEGETGVFGSSMIQKKDYRISVKNAAPSAIAVTVEDQIPVSENTEIRIDALPTNTPATKTKPDDRRGVVQWQLELKPQEAKDIRFGWQAKWPSDRAIQWRDTAK